MIWALWILHLATLLAVSASAVFVAISMVRKRLGVLRVAGVLAGFALLMAVLDWAYGGGGATQLGTLVLLVLWIAVGCGRRRLVALLRDPEGCPRRRSALHALAGAGLLTGYLLLAAALSFVPPSVPFGGGWPYLLLLWLATAGLAFGFHVLVLRHAPFLIVWPRLALLVAATASTMLGLELTWKLADNFGRNGLEIYARGSGMLPDEEGRFVYRGSFGAPREFAVAARRNSDGYNADEVVEQKAAGTRRIVLLGDSYVEALQVGHEAALARQLQLNLQRNRTREGCRERDVECLAFGRAGAGQVESLRVMRQRVSTLAPDLVVTEFLAGNDLYDNEASLMREFRGEVGYRLHRGALRSVAFYRRLEALAAILYRLDRGLAERPTMGLRVDQQVFRGEPLNEAWARAWRVTEQALVDLDRDARSCGARSLVVVFSSPAEIAAFAGDQTGARELARKAAAAGLSAGGWDYRAPSLRIEGFCGALGIPVLNLNRVFARLPAKTRTRLHFPFDGHWNEEGHSQAAAAIADFVAERGLLECQGAVGAGP